MNSTAMPWRIFCYRIPLARMLKNRILQGWMISQYGTLKSKLLKYCLKKSSMPQYHKPPFPPLSSLNFKYSHLLRFWAVDHVPVHINPSSCHLSPFHPVLCCCFKAMSLVRLSKSPFFFPGWLCHFKGLFVPVWCEIYGPKFYWLCLFPFKFVTYLFSFGVFNGPEHSYNAMYTVVFKSGICWCINILEVNRLKSVKYLYFFITLTISHRLKAYNSWFLKSMHIN